MVFGQTGLSLREMKDRKKRFYNNVNSKKLKSEEELITAIAMMQRHQGWRRGGNTNLTVPFILKPDQLYDASRLIITFLRFVFRIYGFMCDLKVGLTYYRPQNHLALRTNSRSGHSPQKK